VDGVTHPGHHSGQGHDHSAAFRDDRTAALLETEGELAAGLTDQAIALCTDLLDVDSARVRRLVDLGCGPGVATSSLAEAFGSAVVVGVDRSPVMLARAADRAARHGVSDRVELRSLDLDDDLHALGTFDLVWAALALHHADDEPAALRSFGALVRPQGLLCLIERADPMVVRLTRDLGRPGIWGRIRSAQSEWFERARPALPGTTNVPNADMLEEAGLELLESRTLTDTVIARGEPALRTLVTGYLRRAERNLDGILDMADLEALRSRGSDGQPADAGWGDAEITSSRTLFIARRTGSTGIMR
jgi:SAM-dependent methyltransferase